MDLDKSISPIPAIPVNIVPEEGRVLNQFAIDEFLKDFRKDLLQVLQNYWVSRALLVLGIVFTYMFGWGLMGLVLFIDLLLHNPNPIYPRDTLLKTGKMIISWTLKSNRKIKKTE